MPTVRLLLIHLAAASGLSNWRPWDERRRMPVPNTPAAPVLPKIVVLGGTGRIGTAVAAHLISRAQPVAIQLAGRDRARGEAALAEVRRERTGRFSQSRFDFLQLDWRDEAALAAALEGAIAVVHTAGPYAGESPDVLRASIAASVPVYVDLSDPVAYLREAKTLGGSARASGTLALCAGGAFPGLSNVIAMECAARLRRRVHDLDFSYFTAGLGGSGAVNLFITNDGFGEEVPVFRAGRLSPQMDAGGGLRRAEPSELTPRVPPRVPPEYPRVGGGLRKVEFFLRGRDEASESLVGERSVWSWPFPEGCTVAERLSITGSSSVGMGTAPELWNLLMGVMVDVVPRGWWKKRSFSQGLADFSQPLVRLTDLFTGETHAMRDLGSSRLLSAPLGSSRLLSAPLGSSRILSDTLGYSRAHCVEFGGGARGGAALPLGRRRGRAREGGSGEDCGGGEGVEGRPHSVLQRGARVWWSERAAGRWS